MKNKGFSLVEILIVVGILSLLAAIAIPNLVRAKVSANDAAAQATLKTIAQAIENYGIENDTYPTANNDLLSGSQPYLRVNFFSGTHNGFQFTSALAQYSYEITATPVNSNAGTSSFTVTTGGALNTSP